MAFKQNDLRLIVPTREWSLSSKTPGLLVGEHVLLGGGAITSTLDLAELVKLDKIFLVDTHLDYITDIAFMVDTCFGRRPSPFEVWAHPVVISALQTHFFNNAVWPDFCELPSKESPSIVLRGMNVGEVLEWDGFKIQACGAHREDSSGKMSFIVTKDEDSFLYAPEGHFPLASAPSSFEFAIFGEQGQSVHSSVKNPFIFAGLTASELGLALQNFLK